MTNVFVSVDMEGIAGIAHLRQVWRGSDDFPAARELMTGEANAAVSGAVRLGSTSTSSPGRRATRSGRVTARPLQYARPET